MEILIEDLKANSNAPCLEGKNSIALRIGLEDLKANSNVIRWS